MGLKTMSVLQFLDNFFLVFHAILTIFGLTGWILKKTRKVHLGYMLLTGFSWVGLGAFYGLGYCPLTDWHWQVLAALGRTDIPRSYVKYFLDTITGLDFDAMLVDVTVAACFATALIISIGLNLRDFLIRRKLKRT